MLKKLVHFLKKTNLFFGCLSLVVVAGGSLVTVTGFGVSHLAKAGVPADREFWERVTHAGVGSIVLGLVGTVTTTAVGASLNSFDGENKEEKNQESSQVTVSQLLSESSEDSQSISEDTSDSRRIYSYHIMKINGHPNFLEDGLVLCRVEAQEQQLLYNFISPSQLDQLATIYGEIYDVISRLVGKCFSSYQPFPKEALDEYLQIHHRYIEAVESSHIGAEYLQSCKGCSYLFAENHVVCAPQPLGWYGVDCPDKRWVSQRALRPYEDDAVVAKLNSRLELCNVIKRDCTILVRDEYTSRCFSFNFDGVLYPSSDKLTELDDMASLATYVDYFRHRKIVECDYSTSDYIDCWRYELANTNVTIDVTDNRIIVREGKSLGSKFHEFRLNGQPFNAYSYACPRDLRNNYNLVSLVDYLKRRSHKKEVS
ncbi:hypothetical protein F7734_04345 [Scytonema sp. UIC 10036]|uniref:hypothetical protein n=1 Tax=Scytonema sp. UIC 10036 TaxID=2304196 RepID=UPI0012DAA4E2|nr:hypothetical protein [Scytonema sp. UIC 10036]MUG91750.1 hypothetical protein [Scytonema sp. UIC 10036]